MLPHKSLFAVVSEDPCAFGLGLAAAAREDAIYFDDIVGLPVVLGAAEINTVLRNQETFSTRAFANGLMKGALVATEGAAHTDMRKLYNSFFAPRQIKAYEESIVLPAVRTVLDRLATRPEPDLLDHFCTEVPQRVVATLFGMSLERIAENDVLVRQILKAIVRPYDAEAVAEGERAYAAMAEELRAISARELEAPSATMLGEIAKALIAQGIGSVEACERIVFTLILGSYETTTWGMASTLAGLLRHPETLARVRDNPASSTPRSPPVSSNPSEAGHVGERGASAGWRLEVDADAAVGDRHRSGRHRGPPARRPCAAASLSSWTVGVVHVSAPRRRARLRVSSRRRRVARPGLDGELAYERIPRAY